MKRDNTKEESSSSNVFAALFANKVDTEVCADNRAESNLMDIRTLSAVEKTSTGVEIEKLDRPRPLKMAAVTSEVKWITIICTRAVLVDTELKIRHVAALVLRNLRWLVTEQSAFDLLLGRTVLEALG